MSQSKNLKPVFNYESWVHAVSGATGSIVAMSVFYPLDTIRFRLQIDDVERRKAQSTIKIFLQLIKEEGFSTLYRGLIPVLQSLCISNFVYFYTFHSLKALNGSQKNQTALKDLLLGIVAGIVNVLTTTPFWVVNTRLKMKGIQGDFSRKSYISLFDGLFHIAKKEGIRGLWAGTIPSLLLVINPALQFMMYEFIKRKMNTKCGELPSFAYFIIGAVAKTFSTFITYPMQLIQTKQRNGHYKKDNLSENLNMIQMILKIIRAQGIQGLYRGLEAKLLQTILTAALMFAVYEKIARYVSLVLIKPIRVAN